MAPSNFQNIARRLLFVSCFCRRHFFCSCQSHVVVTTVKKFANGPLRTQGLALGFGLVLPPVLALEKTDSKLETAGIQISRGEYHQALKILEEISQVSQATPTSTSVKMYQALVHMCLKDYDKALTLWRQMKLNCSETENNFKKLILIEKFITIINAIKSHQSDSMESLKHIIEHQRHVEDEEEVDGATMALIGNLFLLKKELEEGSKLFTHQWDDINQIKLALEKSGKFKLDSIFENMEPWEVLYKRGMMKVGEEYYKNIYEKQKLILGHLHPVALSTLGHVGAFVLVQGRVDDALILMKQLYEESRQALGDSHKETVAVKCMITNLTKWRSKN